MNYLFEPTGLIPTGRLSANLMEAKLARERAEEKITRIYQRHRNDIMLDQLLDFFFSDTPEARSTISQKMTDLTPVDHDLLQKAENNLQIYHLSKRRASELYQTQSS